MEKILRDRITRKSKWEDLFYFGRCFKNNDTEYIAQLLGGRKILEVDDFEVVGEAVVEADMLHGYHHQYLGGPRRMLKSTNGSKVLAA